MSVMLRPCQLILLIILTEILNFSINSACANSQIISIFSLISIITQFQQKYFSRCSFNSIGTKFYDTLSNTEIYRRRPIHLEAILVNFEISSSFEQCKYPEIWNISSAFLSKDGVNSIIFLIFVSVLHNWGLKHYNNIARHVRKCSDWLTFLTTLWNKMIPRLSDCGFR